MIHINIKSIQTQIYKTKIIIYKYHGFIEVDPNAGANDEVPIGP